MAQTTILCGDARAVLSTIPEKTVNACVTSPPYFQQRDYGVEGQIGLEATPQEYVDQMVMAFREVRRVLRDDGTLWLVLGDSFNSGNSGQRAVGMNARCGRSIGQEKQGQGDHRRLVIEGLKRKDLIGIPWRVAFALQADGWWLRSDIIWEKPNPMPDSVQDRPTRAHEYLFLLAKSEKYYYDIDAIREPWADERQGNAGGKRGPLRNVGGRTDGLTRPSAAWKPPAHLSGRNRRTVWTVSPQPYKGAHFAVFPEALIEPCVLAGAPVGGTVLDPFAGSGTTLSVAVKHGRNAIGLELNPAYLPLIHERIGSAQESVA